MSIGRAQARGRAERPGALFGRAAMGRLAGAWRALLGGRLGLGGTPCLGPAVAQPAQGDLRIGGDANGEVGGDRVAGSQPIVAVRAEGVASRPPEDARLFEPRALCPAHCQGEAEIGIAILPPIQGGQADREEFGEFDIAHAEAAEQADLFGEGGIVAGGAAGAHGRGVAGSGLWLNRTGCVAGTMSRRRRAAHPATASARRVLVAPVARLGQSGGTGDLFSGSGYAMNIKILSSALAGAALTIALPLMAQTTPQTTPGTMTTPAPTTPAPTPMTQPATTPDSSANPALTPDSSATTTPPADDATTTDSSGGKEKKHKKPK